MNVQPEAVPRDGTQPVLTEMTTAEDFDAHLGRLRAQRAQLGDSVSAVGLVLEAPVARGGMWRERVRAALAELAHDFEDHVTLTECADGLYDRVRHAAPRLSGTVDRLRAEHGELRDALRGYLAVIEHGGTMADLPVFREELGTLVNRIVRHRRKGDDLIHEAYAVDLGGSG